jgi:hypothetical protein
MEKLPDAWKQLLALTTNIYKLIKRTGFDMTMSYFLGNDLRICMIDPVTVHFAVRCFHFSAGLVQTRSQLVLHLDGIRTECLESKQPIAVLLFSFVRDGWLVGITRDVQLARKALKTFFADAAPHVESFDFDKILGGTAEMHREAVASEAAGEIRTLGQRWTKLRTDCKALCDFYSEAMPKLNDGMQPSSCIDTFKEACTSLETDLASEASSKFALTLGTLTGLQTVYKEGGDELSRKKLAQRCIFLLSQTAMMSCDTRVTTMLSKVAEGK